MKWHSEPLLGFDTETTGTDVWNDRIVSACLVEVDVDGNSRPHEWLIDPGIPIPDEAHAIHGISTERVRADGSSPAESIEQITAMLAEWLGHGKPLVVFNATFDLNLLEAENARHGLRSLASRLGGAIAPVLDPLVIDKHVDPFRKGKRWLTSLCQHYGVSHQDAHDARGDALAAVALIQPILTRYPDLTDYSPMDFHDAQILWREVQQANLADYFHRCGKHDLALSLSTSWPIEPAELV